MQTTYTQAQRALAGLIADNDTVKDVVSGVNAEGSAAMTFGNMVAVYGERQYKLLAGSGDKPGGIVVYSPWYERSLELDATTGGPIAGAKLQIMRKGRIWVPVETALALTDSLFTRYSGTGVQGAFRNVNDAGHSTDVSKVVKAMTILSGAGLAVVEIDVTAF